jgi:hypothetical protein
LLEIWNVNHCCFENETLSGGRCAGFTAEKF